MVGYNDGSIEGRFACGDASVKGYGESCSHASGLIAAEGENSNIASCFRYNRQTITEFDSTSASYNKTGTESTLEDIIWYCKLILNGDVWPFEKASPAS